MVGHMRSPKNAHIVVGTVQGIVGQVLQQEKCHPIHPVHLQPYGCHAIGQHKHIQRHPAEHKIDRGIKRGVGQVGGSIGHRIALAPYPSRKPYLQHYK